MKILMVGLGSIGQRHLRNVIAVLGSEVEISAYRVRKEQTVITPSLQIEEAAELDKKYNYTIYNDLDSALSVSPDAVLICNPSSMHVQVALQAVKHGCHIFVEKPLSHNLDNLDELCSLVREKGIVALVGFQLRFHPCFQQLKKLIMEERVGELLAVQTEVGEHLPDWHSWEDYRRMYASRRDLGGGVVLTQIHEIDYTSDLFGHPNSVYAVGGHFSSLELQDVEDTADVLMECSYKGRTLPVYLHMDYLQKPPSRKCRVIGEKGTMTMDFHALKVRVVKREGEVESFDFNGFDRNQLFLDEVKHFFACIREKERPIVDIETACAGMRAAMAIKESMLKGEKVLLN